MRVKVLLRAQEDQGSKIEYFNDVDSWFVEGGVLHLEKNRPEGGSAKKVASINYWVWVKEDE